MNWLLMEKQFDHWTGRIGEEFTAFKNFITGSLPSVGMGGLGLFTGFRRR